MNPQLPAHIRQFTTQLVDASVFRLITLTNCCIPLLHKWKQDQLVTARRSENLSLFLSEQKDIYRRVRVIHPGDEGEKARLCAHAGNDSQGLCCFLLLS